VSTQPTPPDAVEPPVETPFADAASPFVRTEPGFPPGPPAVPPPRPAQSTWVIYRSQINFGLAILAYLMILVGSVIVVQANPEASWRYYVAALPAIPAAIALFIFARGLMRLDDLHVRIQIQALGIALGGTGLITFAYGFLEGAGLPHLSWTYVVPLMAVLWSLATAFFTFRYR
jgi:hypothetical protein